MENEQPAPSADFKEARADALAAKARAKSLRPWFKKKRYIFPIVLTFFIVMSSASNQSGDSKSAHSGSVSVETPASNEVQTSDSSKSTESTSQAQARKKAESYLEFSAFSKKGLVKQLEFEGFDTDDATYAVNALDVDVDWNEQAALKAKSYLEFSAFSHSGLVKQLLFEGFTDSEAEFGVASVGL